MAKKISFILASLLTIYIIANCFFIFQLVTAGQKYLILNFSASQNQLLISIEAKKIIKNYQKIDKNLKKIVLKDWAQDFELILNKFLNGQEHCLVLLQNNDEIRATGGFIGSYLFLDFNQGQWKINPIQDIYDLTGQQENFPAAPDVYQKYLGEGQGFAIQDANWWPNTSTSAKNILSIWQEIEKTSPYVNDDQEITQVVFLNLNFIEKLISLLGPINLPDYQEEVDADNFSQLARASRIDFFAGSNEKANFLNHFKTALILKIQALSWSEKIAFAQKLIPLLDKQSIQIYSPDNKLESIWQKHDLSQDLVIKDSKKLFFASIESNVGINKANQLIERHFTIKENQDQEVKQIEIEFINHNQKPTIINLNPDLKTADHLSYVNYQRFYFSPDIKISRIEEIKNNNQKEAIEFKTAPYFNDDGQELILIDLLLVVPEESASKIIISLDASTKQGIEINQQSGISDTKQSWTISSDQLE